MKRTSITIMEIEAKALKHHSKSRNREVVISTGIALLYGLVKTGRKLPVSTDRLNYDLHEKYPYPAVVEYAARNMAGMKERLEAIRTKNLPHPIVVNLSDATYEQAEYLQSKLKLKSISMVVMTAIRMIDWYVEHEGEDILDNTPTVRKVVQVSLSEDVYDSLSQVAKELVMTVPALLALAAKQAEDDTLLRWVRNRMDGKL